MKLRTFLLGLSAFCIAAAAAYFSVTGLSRLFAGASTAVILMASSLEFGKLISASFLYVYWDNINKVLRTYLLIGVSVLILITSAGIYGFLTSAYQVTSDKLTIIDKGVQVLEMKKARYQEQLNNYTTERTSLTQTISDLSKGLSGNVVQYKDKDGTLITTSSSAARKSFEKQLDEAKNQRNLISSKIDALTDSVTKLDLQIIEISSGNELASEVGPLKFMAEITGKPMSTIVNWFALFIVFVFDPLAVTLVIAFNTALKVDKGEDVKDDKTSSIKKYKIYNDKNKTKQDITENEFDELSYLDTPAQILDLPKGDVEKIINTIENPPAPSESIKKAVDNYNDPELENLKRDFSKRAIDVDGDGSVDGFDYNGDGLIDRYTNTGRILEKDNRAPYYARPEFDWNDKAKWINDQNAVNYWLVHKKI